MLTILDEGVPLAANTTGIDFVGAGVTASGSGPTKTVTIPGASSPLTTKGDLYGFTTVDARVPVGVNGQVLKADSTAASGVAWGNLPNVIAGPLHRYTSVRDDGTTNAVGIASLTTTNTTATAATIGNIVTQNPRYRAAVPTAANSRALGSYADGSRIWYRGGSAGLGGYYMRWLFALETNQTNMAWICGITSFSTFAYPSTATQPSAMLDCIVAGCDTGDTNVQIMHNDGSGSCTKLDTGINGRTSGSFFELFAFCTPNGSVVDVSVRLIGGATYTASLNSNLPTATVGTGPCFGGWQSAGLAGIGYISLMYFGVDTPGYFPA